MSSDEHLVTARLQKINILPAATVPGLIKGGISSWKMEKGDEGVSKIIENYTREIKAAKTVHRSRLQLTTKIKILLFNLC